MNKKSHKHRQRPNNSLKTRIEKPDFSTHTRKTPTLKERQRRQEKKYNKLKDWTDL